MVKWKVGAVVFVLVVSVAVWGAAVGAVWGAQSVGRLGFRIHLRLGRYWRKHARLKPEKTGPSLIEYRWVIAWPVQEVAQGPRVWKHLRPRLVNLGLSLKV